MLANTSSEKKNHANFIWPWIQVNMDMLRNTTKQQVGMKTKKRQTWSLHSLWSHWGGIHELNTDCVCFYLRLHVGSALAAGQYVLTANDVSLYIYVKVPKAGLLSQVGRTLPPSCAEFTGVESLSAIIDGDPPESMRLGNQGSPSVWRTGRPSVVGRKEEGCVWCSCVNLRL